MCGVGEWELGGGKGGEKMMFVRLGRGMGGGVMLKGKV